AEHGEAPACECRERHRRRADPGAQPLRIEASAGVDAEYREVLPGIEPGPKLLHRALAGPDHLGIRGGGDPTRQRRLSDAGAGGAQQLEQGAGTETLEVVSVEMGGDAEAGALLTLVHPAMLQPDE